MVNRGFVSDDSTENHDDSASPDQDNLNVDLDNVKDDSSHESPDLTESQVEDSSVDNQADQDPFNVDSEVFDNSGSETIIIEDFFGEPIQATDVRLIFSYKIFYGKQFVLGYFTLLEFWS